MWVIDVLHLRYTQIVGIIAGLLLFAWQSITSIIIFAILIAIGLGWLVPILLFVDFLMKDV